MLLAVASVIAMVACGGAAVAAADRINDHVGDRSRARRQPIQYGQTSQCSATVMGTGNFSSAVTWTASAGSISARLVHGQRGMFRYWHGHGNLDTGFLEVTASITVNPISTIRQ